MGCALAAVAALLAPAALDGPGERARPAPEPRAAAPARDAEGATREGCERPEAGLRPSPDSGPAVRRIKARASGKLIAGVDQNSYR